MKKLAIKEIEHILFQEEVSTELWGEIEKDERVGVKRLMDRYYREKRKREEERMLFDEMSLFERQLKTEGVKFIAGIDEVGRGPLAGPVVACAVILPDDFYLPGLTDSKKLSKMKRESFFEKIHEEALAIHVSMVSPIDIDKLNIYQATIKAMKDAVNGLAIRPDHLLIDAMKLPIPTKQTSLIKGDERSITIAASSVVAKVTRDRYMEQLSKQYPEYFFHQNMGYGTKDHLLAIEKYGITKEHRRSYSPVKEVSERLKER